jgi:hypothetical protein
VQLGEYTDQILQGNKPKLAKLALEDVDRLSSPSDGSSPTQIPRSTD